MIYIKTNMPEMPKSCYDCECRMRDGECVLTGDFADIRPDWCPLVEKKENEE